MIALLPKGVIFEFFFSKVSMPDSLDISCSIVSVISLLILLWRLEYFFTSISRIPIVSSYTSSWVGQFVIGLSDSEKFASYVLAYIWWVRNPLRLAELLRLRHVFFSFDVIRLQGKSFDLLGLTPVNVLFSIILGDRQIRAAAFDWLVCCY